MKMAGGLPKNLRTLTSPLSSDKMEREQEARMTLFRVYTVATVLMLVAGPGAGAQVKYYSIGMNLEG